ncbi:hypothetical protein [Tahibacter sp.]|uniref:hypothetical protein n=1 Tax=Tahibacter sp. TaxID=2056211 RepID=UPI0028C45E8C|nr:hypothetical protein [Tahibacter sp.]
MQNAALVFLGSAQEIELFQCRYVGRRYNYSPTSLQVRMKSLRRVQAQSGALCRTASCPTTAPAAAKGNRGSRGVLNLFASCFSGNYRRDACKRQVTFLD